MQSRRPRRLVGNWGRARHWCRYGRLIAPFLILAILIILVLATQNPASWTEALDGLHQLDDKALRGAFCATAASYAARSSLELFARPLVRPAATWQRQIAIAFVSYSYNMNFGAWLGNVGLRYQLYSRLGIGPRNIAQVIGIGIATSWSGYFLLAGIAGLTGFIRLPPGWRIGLYGLQSAGAAALFLLFVYFYLCARMEGKRWGWKHVHFRIPSLQAAIAHVATSAASWSATAAALYFLLEGKGSYAEVLSVFLLASMSGAIAHVPGGLGIFEGTVLALLDPHVSRGTSLSALLAFRAIYYWSPLPIATAVYLFMRPFSRRKHHAPRPDVRHDIDGSP